MNEPLLFSIDLDGTALTDEETLHPAVPGAVRRAIDAGHTVIIGTGRPLAASRWVWTRCGLDTPMCLHDGALVLNPSQPGQHIFARLVSAESAAEAFRLAYACAEGNVRIHFEYLDQLAMTGVPNSSYYAMLARHCHTRYFSRDAGQPDTPATRICFYFETETEQLRFHAALAADSTLRTVLHRMGGYRVAVYHREADKLHAVSAAAAFLGFPPERVYAFGDAWNDIALLERLPHGYAMRGSAAATVIPRTTRLTCAEGGLADAIDAILAGVL